MQYFNATIWKSILINSCSYIPNMGIEIFSLSPYSSARSFVCVISQYKTALKSWTEASSLAFPPSITYYSQTVAGKLHISSLYGAEGTVEA